MIYEPHTCACHDVGDILRAQFEGKPAPMCEAHRAEAAQADAQQRVTEQTDRAIDAYNSAATSGSSMALNSPGIAATVAAALGSAEVTTEL